jgi:hypothetical protein
MIRRSRTNEIVSQIRGRGRQVLETLKEVRRGDLEINPRRTEERAYRNKEKGPLKS